MKKIRYPKSATGSQVDNYHGTSIADPYRWLEDVDTPDTLEWIKSQNDVTYKYLSQIPARDRLRKRLTELWDYPRAMTIHHCGERYFQFRNSGLQNQDVLYVMENPKDPGRMLLDPNTLSDDGTAALNSWSVSDDGNWLAYAISRSGSDWMQWRVRDISKGEDLPEKLEWSKFSGASWAHDNSGFYYCRYAQPATGEIYQETNYNQTVYFHRIKTQQSEDLLIYARPDQPEWGFYPEVSFDGRFLVMIVSQDTDTRNRLFFKDLRKNGEFIELIKELEAAYSFIGNDGEIFYFQTDRKSPRGSVQAIDINQPEPSKRKTLIPEGKDTLEAISLINDQFVAIYLHGAHEVLKRFALDGTLLGEIQLPMIGSVTYGYASTLAGRRTDNEMFYLFHSFAHPVTVFRYDFTKDISEIIFKPAIRSIFPHISPGRCLQPARMEQRSLCSLSIDRI